MALYCSHRDPNSSILEESNMNRKKIILLCTVAGLILLLSLTAGFLLLKFYRDTAYHRYIRESWGIRIPLTAQGVYHDEDRGWFGEGDW